MKIRKILYLNISNLHDNSKKYHLFYLEKTVFLSNFSCFLKILLQVGLKEKPIWQMTGEEFLFLQQNSESKQVQSAATAVTNPQKKYVYGIAGIARLFGCSTPTANRIKQSGKIDKAITQIGRKIIVDAELALELAGRKSGGRK